ncbi:hypothetical protein AVEN_266363-1 [Araneus ventricosus]|uniref:Uncharacterized protein n=1 Tax=Araneus ventricosus TaxID=182803 RepID=A0A4Y2CPT2_ARAVE|nr:hypothetical protein AVEN_266363-1 [Araneus ventricosus]
MLNFYVLVEVSIPLPSGGLVVRSRLRNGWVPSSKPDSIDIYVDLLHIKSYVVGQTSSRWFGAKACRRGCQLRCRPRYLTTVQSYDVRLKVALVLLQNGT